jgi:hypothetical protein
MKTRVIQDEPDRTAAPLPGPKPPGLAGWIRRHRLITFFVLAYALAWWSWPLYQYDIWPRQAFNAIGALLAAIVVIAVAEGRAGFRDLGRRMIRWRVPWYYYAFALLLPVVLRAATTVVNDAPAPDWTNLSWSSFVTMPDLGYTGDALARQQLLEFIGWTLVALVLVVADRAVWRTPPEAAVYHDDRR